MKKTKILAFFLAVIFSVNLTFAVERTFEDVPKGDDQFEAIEWLHSLGIAENSDRFYPKRPVTLAEFAVMALAAAGVENENLPRGGGSQYADVPADAWFTPQIRLLESAGMLSEFKGNRLLPNRTLTRGEAIALGLDIFGFGVPITLEEDFGFTDLKPTHRLYREIGTALKAGLIDPVSETNFGVSEKMTRGEAAEFLYELASYIPAGGDGPQIIIQTGLPSNIPNVQKLEGIWGEVLRRFLYAEDIDEEDMLYGAIKGMLETLDDPYTAFYTPDEASASISNLEGELEGIGVFLAADPENRGILIVAPISGGPAEEAGLKAGDVIIKVDGESLAGVTAEEGANKIRGEAGTDVKLTIIRDGKEKNITVTREKLTNNSVEVLETKNDVAIVKVNQFVGTTPSLFEEAMAEVKKDTPRGLIIDLRGNGGGLVDAAVDMLGHFLPKNTLAFTQESREDLDETTVYSTARTKQIPDIPVVILVDEGTASASEIFAATLQDYDRATVIGTQTFGKGVVQEISVFSDGTALKLTTGHWLSPNDQLINGHGVTPDLIIEDDPETNDDETLEEALNLIN